VAILHLKTFNLDNGALTGKDAVLITAMGEPFAVLSAPVQGKEGLTTRVLVLYGTSLTGELDVTKQQEWNDRVREALAKAGQGDTDARTSRDPEGERAGDGGAVDERTRNIDADAVGAQD